MAKSLSFRLSSHKESSLSPQKDNAMEPIASNPKDLLTAVLFWFFKEKVIKRFDLIRLLWYNISKLYEGFGYDRDVLSLL